MIVGDRAATPRTPGQQAGHPGPPGPRTLLDWLLVLLSWLSAGLAGWLLIWPPSGDRHEQLLWADGAISAFFALTICVRWLRFRIGWRYLRKHWWEAVALVPYVVFGGWSFVGWVVLAARVVRVVDRTDNVFGDRITAQLVRHFSEPIVNAIKRPITIAVLDEVIDVIKTGDYATNLSHALDENRLELESLVLDLLKEDRTTGKLKYVPFHDDIVKIASDAVFRIVQGALDDPRVHELIADVIRNSATQLQQSVRLGMHE